MITIGEMQISGMLTMILLSVMLVMCAPGRSIRHTSFARARLIMASGTALIAIQFALQHTLKFRQMGVTQGVLLNQLFFTPATLLCSMAILYMQRRGYIARSEWLISGSICALLVVILICTVLTDGVPIQQESAALRSAEYIGAVLYAVIQSYIFVRQYKAYKRIEQAVGEFYDRSRHDLFGWMGLSMKVMAVLAFLVPVVTFMQGTPLILFSIAYFFAISYSTISLYTYGVSRDIERVEEAEDIEPVEESENTEPAALNTGHETPWLAVQLDQEIQSWKQSGAYREHNLTLSIVARQMGVPQRQLQQWLRQSEYKKLAGLVSSLRIEEARRVLKEHPEWSVESVADYCGFNDRKYFHQVFLQYTGTTPAKYQMNLKSEE